MFEIRLIRTAYVEAQINLAIKTFLSYSYLLNSKFHNKDDKSSNI